ncbi:MAG: hypothetical protein H6815_03955 [Phycisphaeraceae bacterium]|nr:hypothetical protein [Phycisphaerales bacterium]MCB9859584.1 hypothetical protein [Phycisphaeraceae bacterium]
MKTEETENVSAAMAPPDNGTEPLVYTGQAPWLANIPIRLVVGAVVAGFAGTEIYKAVSTKLPIPWLWIIGPAVVGAAAACLVPRPRWIRALRIESGEIGIRDSRNTRTALQTDDVLLVAGVKGPSFDGGDLVAPQSVHLMTTQGNFRIKLGYDGAKHCYDNAIQHCHLAAHLDFSGTLHKPDWMEASESHADTQAWMQDVRSMVKSAYRSMISQAFGAMFALVLLGCGLIAGAVVMGMQQSGSSSHRGPIKLGILGFIVVVVGLGLAGYVFSLQRQKSRLLRELV